MSSTEEKDNNKNEDNNNQKKQNSIKIAIISQQSSYIDVYKLFDSCFKYSKLEYYKIKNEDKYEFSLLNFPQLLISIYNIKNIENIENIHQKDNILFNFFIILIDIQNKNTISYIDKTIDAIIEDDDNIDQKAYIYGFYYNNNNERYTEDKISSILETKGIDYYYNEIKSDDIETFSKLIECTVNDCNAIMIENLLAQKQKELNKDKSNSNCFIY
jgi:hypothetical protein